MSEALERAKAFARQQARARAREKGSVASGILLLVGLHVAAGLVCFALYQVSEVFAALPMVVGVSQLIYVVPASVRLGRHGQTRTVQGLWICAGITFLLNATCFGIVLTSL